MVNRESLQLPLLASASLASGASLIVAIVFKVSLGLVLIFAALTVTPLFWYRFSKLKAPLRAEFKARAKQGVLIGGIATIAYDLSRLLLVKLGNLHFYPFETFALFGYSIIGAGVSRPQAFIAGTAYHFLNGVTFAVGYCLLLGGRSWALGLLWALGLEVLMFTIYPTWLNLKAVMVEFTAVSVTGHFAYGLTLGLLGQHWLRAKTSWRSEATK